MNSPASSYSHAAHDQPNPTGLRERKKREARRHVREIALNLFVAHGYDAVSVEQIAEAADVSRTTFFNYYPTKEAVLTGPDASALEQLADAFDRRPAQESLWESLTAVMLNSLADSENTITAQKNLQASSPALAHVMQNRSRPLVEHLRERAELRLDDDRRPQALLQLNAMVAAVSTAFEQWNLEEPYERFTRLAAEHLEALGRAFVSGTP